jgi:nitrate reductase gamma subunit
MGDTPTLGLTSQLNKFFFGYFPYIAMTIFLLGSAMRYDRDQYTWKSDSSQLLRKKGMLVGSNLFHNISPLI